MKVSLTQRHRTILALIAGALISVAAILWFVEAIIVGTEWPWSVTLREGMLIVAAIVAGTPIAIRALQALRFRAFSIDLLVTVAVIGALIIGEFVESAVVSFLFLFGAWLEARSLERTRASLAELIDLAPTEATVIRDGARVTVPADEVEVGEHVIILTGERIAVDGEILSGSAEVSEASITGESVALEKSAGDTVYAGTIVESGHLTVVSRRTGDSTTFARMIELVEEAQESKTARQRFLDRFAAFYTPAIIVVAIITWVVTRDIAFALTFLVIACPGALVISVPVAAVAGLGKIARHGVLVKDAESLETLAGATELMVDKTGTLTRGAPSVSRIAVVSPFTEDEVVNLAASAETASEHISARTIVQYAHDAGHTLQPVTNVSLALGVGVQGNVGDRLVIVGRRSLLTEAGVEIDEASLAEIEARETSGSSVAYIAIDHVYAGYIDLRDEIRADADAALQSMRRHGIERVTMLTGDNAHIADRVGAALGLDEVHSGLLPEEKVAFVTRSQESGRTVAMVGDGVNDAAALATADVGIAMGDSGTDISVETADVVILGGKLEQLAYAQRVAQHTLRIMRQNMVISLGTVALLIAGVFLGHIHLASGMLVHEASVLLVVLNALRLSRIADRRTPAPHTPVKGEQVRVPTH